MGGDWRQHDRLHATPSFNPRPRVGGDASTTRPSGCWCSFNPRPRVGGDRRVCGEARAGDVSIHAPAWGATASFGPRSLSRSLFQSTPPRGGRPSRSVPARSAAARFNPRPRVGGDLRHRPSAVRALVSIHAPAWGATLEPPELGEWLNCFNPRPRVGGDRSAPEFVDGDLTVSIHAPAWGATPSIVIWLLALLPFQSTPPRGGRHHRRGRGGSRSRGFNPRPRVGGDTLHTYASGHPSRFQSTPPRGGRPIAVDSGKSP